MFNISCQMIRVAFLNPSQLLLRQGQELEKGKINMEQLNKDGKGVPKMSFFLNNHAGKQIIIGRLVKWNLHGKTMPVLRTMIYL